MTLRIPGSRYRGNAARYAIFDELGGSRYVLGRQWTDDTVLPTMVFVGVNPSNADEENDDPTIRKEIGFAKRYRCGGIVKVNLSPYITPYMPKLRAWLAGAPPIQALRPRYDSENARALRWALSRHGCGSIFVAAWGNLDTRLTTALHGPLSIVTVAAGNQLYCFGKTKLECPRHTSRIAYSTPLVSMDSGALHPRSPI